MNIMKKDKLKKDRNITTNRISLSLCEDTLLLHNI